MLTDEHDILAKAIHSTLERDFPVLDYVYSKRESTKLKIGRAPLQIITTEAYIKYPACPLLTIFYHEDEVEIDVWVEGYSRNLKTGNNDPIPPISYSDPNCVEKLIKHIRMVRDYAEKSNSV